MPLRVVQIRTEEPEKNKICFVLIRTETMEDPSFVLE
jgi:hypothetical protein